MARGTCTTSMQMTKAPHGSHFVWVHGDLSYPRALAKKLGREDLVIVSPDFFRGDRWRGIEFKGIVVDHAADLGPFNEEKWINYDRATAYIR